MFAVISIAYNKNPLPETIKYCPINLWRNTCGLKQKLNLSCQNLNHVVKLVSKTCMCFNGITFETFRTISCERTWPAAFHIYRTCKFFEARAFERFKIHEIPWIIHFQCSYWSKWIKKIIRSFIVYLNEHWNRKIKGKHKFCVIILEDY